MIEIKATLNDSGRTILKLIQKYFPNLSKGFVEKLFRKNEIKINGLRKIQKNQIVSENDAITIYGLSESDFQKEYEVKKSTSVNLKVLYEDENILVLNKATGISVHDEDDSLDEQVLSYLNYVPTDSFKPTHVGRLDKETSGIITYAKTYEAARQLNDNSEFIVKKYIFISDIKLDNFFEHKPFVVNNWIYKDESNKKMKVSKNNIKDAKQATTLFYSEKNRKIAQIKTGRKHQIRVTLSNLGFPIYGDKKYGGKKETRLMLHSYYVKYKNMKNNLSYLNDLELYCLPNWKKG
ncbi:RluA family pseudouridine synthase [Mycoplasma sp. 4404]|uniref:RluA family pseudouridine synthase n=1 Tax=Mycoplasma sp. 4404 TaxID=3108530 RepID=UPI002B1D5C69|nr:RluA family pseudouridine synthase [Mycoplasma sp. 4404]MEA4162674.1 RluA family pseudouridine synthase [Mycoplasma sp. 4404]